MPKKAEKSTRKSSRVGGKTVARVKRSTPRVRQGVPVVKAKPSVPRKRKPAEPVKASTFTEDSASFEAAISSHKAGQRYVLRLYVTGSTPRSIAAITNIRRLCDERLAGKYDLEVIDIYQQPVLAAGDQIIAAPTLIKQFPFPLRKVVGDLSNEDRILVGLDLVRRKSS